MGNSAKTHSRIIVINSDPLTLTATAATLHYGGNECICARDAEAAWKAVRNYEIDLIVCDNDLPDVCGVELIRAIRSEDGMQDTPIILIGDEGSPAVIDQVHSAGATFYLRKPFDPQVLVELVDKSLWMPAANPFQQRSNPPRPIYFPKPKYRDRAPNSGPLGRSSNSPTNC